MFAKWNSACFFSISVCMLQFLSSPVGLNIEHGVGELFSLGIWKFKAEKGSGVS